MLAIDLFCGLGGWTDGLLAEGYDVVGFDMERHDYGTGGYPAQLVLQDVMTIHGKQFKDATLIVASPPCQKYSYMAMPWSKSKALIEWYRDPEHPERIVELNALFDACFRIQREASDAAGHHIPLIVENVRGAIPWLGRSRWNYGSYHLWGDVPALMPMTRKGFKSSGMNWRPGNPGQDFTRIAGQQAIEGMKNSGGSWFGVDPRGNVVEPNNGRDAGQKTVGHINKRDGHGHTRHLTNQAESDHVKQSGIGGTRNNGKGDAWFQDGAARSGSKSKARKAASAAIAKIPFHLAQYIAHHFKNP